MFEKFAKSFTRHTKSLDKQCTAEIRNEGGKWTHIKHWREWRDHILVDELRSRDDLRDRVYQFSNRHNVAGEMSAPISLGAGETGGDEALSNILEKAAFRLYIRTAWLWGVPAAAASIAGAGVTP